MINLEDNKFQEIDNQEMNMLELIFAQGIGKKMVADKGVITIYNEIDDLILNVSKRFWEKRQ